MNAKHDDHIDDPSASGLSRNQSERVSPGELLREGRLANDYSISDLCAQTKLSTRTIEALEDNDFQALSQPVFAGGYYRQCAKVLDLDVERMAGAYKAWAGEPRRPRLNGGAAVDVGVIPRDVTPRRTSRFRSLLLFILLLAVAAIVAIVLFMPGNRISGAISSDINPSGNGQSTTVSVDSSQTGASGSGGEPSVGGASGATGTGGLGTVTAAGGTPPAVAGKGSTPAGQRAATPSAGSVGQAATRASQLAANTANAGTPTTTGAASATAPAVGSQTTTEGTSAANANPPSGGNAPAATAGSQPRGGRNVNQALGIQPPSSSVNRPTPAGGNNQTAAGNGPPAVPANQLVLTFTKRSWVRVTDANGNRMASGIFKAGDKKEFDGTPPYKITIGYAPGVSVSIGGHPVNVSGGQSSKGGVAHLTVHAAHNSARQSGTQQ